MQPSRLWTVAAVAIISAVLVVLMRPGERQPEPEAPPPLPTGESAAGEMPPPAATPAVADPSPALEVADEEPYEEPERHGAGVLRVRGTVTFPTGEPASGAEMAIHVIEENSGRLAAVEQLRLEADEDGGYSQQLPDPAAVYYIQAVHADYGNVSSPLVGPEYTGSFFPGSGEEWDAVRDLVLRPGSAFSGTLVYTDGEPADGVELLGYQSSMTTYRSRIDGRAHSRFAGAELRTVAAADGTFDLPGTAPGPVYLLARSGSEVLATWRETAPREGLELTVPRPGTRSAAVEGTVYDFADRIAISDAEVRLVRTSIFQRTATPADVLAARVAEPMAARTGAAGRFRFEDLPPGEYLAGLRAGDFVLLEAAPPRLVLNPGGPTATIIVGEEEDGGAELTLLAGRGYEISGQAVQHATGEPLPEVELSARSLGNPLFGQPAHRVSFVTNENGRFNLYGFVQDGSFPIRIESEEYEAVISGSSSREAGTPWRLNLVTVGMTPGQQRNDVVIELNRIYRARGRVVTSGGDPFPGAEARLHLTRRSGRVSVSRVDGNWTRVDSDGTFDFPVPGGSLFAIQAREGEGGVSSDSERMEVADGDIEDMEIVLGRAGSISGRFVFPDGFDPLDIPSPSLPGLAPDPPAQVSIFQDSGIGIGIGGTELQPDGGFHLSPLGPGDYRILLSHPRLLQVPPFEVSLREGQHLSGLEFEVDLAGRIDILVQDEAGEPIPGASVELTVISDGGSTERGFPARHTGPDGRYRLAGISGESARLVLAGPPLADGAGVQYERKEVAGFPLDGDPRVFTLEAAEMEERATITVYLFDGETGEPVSEDRFRVERGTPAGGSAGIRVSSGYFVDERPRRGPNVYTISASSYSPKSVTVHSIPSEGDQEEVVMLFRGSRLTGRAVPAGGGSVSVADLRVRLLLPGMAASSPLDRSAGGAVAFTGADGRFSFDRVPPGEVGVHVQPAGELAGSRVTVTVPEDGSPVDVGDIPVGTGGKVRVRVLMGDSGAPAEGTTLRLTRIISGDFSGPASAQGARPLQGTPDSQGAYTFTGLAPGLYHVAVRIARERPGESGTITTTSQPRQVDVSHGSEEELIFEVMPGAGVSGSWRVVDRREGVE